MKWYIWLLIGIVYFIIAILVTTLLKKDDKEDYDFNPVIGGSLWPALLIIEICMLPFIIIDWISDVLDEHWQQH